MIDSQQKAASRNERLTATDLAPRPLGGSPVLVLESGEDDAAALTALLRLNGFNARSMQTGADALSALATLRPRVVLMDLDLPDCDACDLIRKVRANPNAPAIVVLTGHTDRVHRCAAIEAGASEYWLKPAEPIALVRMLQQHCHSAN